MAQYFNDIPNIRFEEWTPTSQEFHRVPYFDFDGIYVSQGYLQLNSVNILENKFVESYEITIYGLLSSFARDINKNFLTDLSTLSVYNHTSSLQNITSSWEGNLFDGDIVYPLADYGQNINYQAALSVRQFGVDNPKGALTVQDFKPAIRVKKVFDADYTPKDKFKRRLFDDWDSEEWNKFYSFIYYCVSVYFEEGVYGPNYDKSADEINMMFEMDNGVRYNEVKRIWEKLKNNNSFTVTDIKNITNEVFKFEQYKPVHDNNARRVMTLFFKKEGITNVKYVKNTKTWIITRETVAKSESRQNKEKEIDFPLF